MLSINIMDSIINRANARVSRGHNTMFKLSGSLENMRIDGFLMIYRPADYSISMLTYYVIEKWQYLRLTGIKKVT